MSVNLDMQVFDVHKSTTYWGSRWVLWIIGISYKPVGGYFKGCIDKVYWYVKCVSGTECAVNNAMK